MILKNTVFFILSILFLLHVNESISKSKKHKTKPVTTPETTTTEAPIEEQEIAEQEEEDNEEPENDSVKVTISPKNNTTSDKNEEETNDSDETNIQEEEQEGENKDSIQTNDVQVTTPINVQTNNVQVTTPINVQTTVPDDDESDALNNPQTTLAPVKVLKLATTPRVPVRPVNLNKPLAPKPIRKVPTGSWTLACPNPCSQECAPSCTPSCCESHFSLNSPPIPLSNNAFQSQQPGCSNNCQKNSCSTSCPQECCTNTDVGSTLKQFAQQLDPCPSFCDMDACMQQHPMCPQDCCSALQFGNLMTNQNYCPPVCSQNMDMCLSNCPMDCCSTNTVNLNDRVSQTIDVPGGEIVSVKKGNGCPLNCSPRNCNQGCPLACC